MEGYSAALPIKARLELIRVVCFLENPTRLRLCHNEKDPHQASRETSKGCGSAWGREHQCSAPKMLRLRGRTHET
jgi:hypothetical protein